MQRKLRNFSTQSFSVKAISLIVLLFSCTFNYYLVFSMQNFTKKEIPILRIILFKVYTLQIQFN